MAADVCKLALDSGGGGEVSLVGALLLPVGALVENFGDLLPPLVPVGALVEAFGALLLSWVTLGALVEAFGDLLLSWVPGGAGEFSGSVRWIT